MRDVAEAKAEIERGAAEGPFQPEWESLLDTSKLYLVPVQALLGISLGGFFAGGESKAERA